MQRIRNHQTCKKFVPIHTLIHFLNRLWHLLKRPFSELMPTFIHDYTNNVFTLKNIFKSVICIVFVVKIFYYFIKYLCILNFELGILYLDIFIFYFLLIVYDIYMNVFFVCLFTFQMYFRLKLVIFFWSFSFADVLPRNTFS